jgi:hypothetical protein
VQTQSFETLWWALAKRSWRAKLRSALEKIVSGKISGTLKHNQQGLQSDVYQRDEQKDEYAASFYPPQPPTD